MSGINTIFYVGYTVVAHHFAFASVIMQAAELNTKSSYFNWLICNIHPTEQVIFMNVNMFISFLV